MHAGTVAPGDGLGGVGDIFKVKMPQLPTKNGDWNIFSPVAC